MRIDVWSDVVCPFCYIGKRKLEMALQKTAIAADVEWHSFELSPMSPRSFGQPLADVVAGRHRASRAQAVDLLEYEQRAAEQVGLQFNWRDAKPGNTFDAHRLIQLGTAHRLGDAVQERMMRAYFTEGQEIGDPVVLRRLAVEAGLAEAAVDSVLGSDEFATEVRDDERRAAELGISGVPYFVINGRSVISGARDVAVFVAALQSESASQSPGSDGGPGCSDGFCEIQPVS